MKWFTASNKGLADKKQDSSELLGIGIGVPGPVDDLVVKRAVNLGWSDFPLKQLMEKRLEYSGCFIE